MPDSAPDATAPLEAGASTDPGAPRGSDGAPPALPPEPPGRRWPWVLGALGVVVALAAVAAALIRVPKVIIRPGGGTPVGSVVSMSGAPTYRHRGAVLFLTVQVSSQRPNLYEYLDALRDPDATVVDEKQVFGGQSRSQDRRLDVALMQQSQQIATKVALEKLGYRVPVHGTGVLVAHVASGSPAAGKLRVRDVITAVDGAPVTLADQLGTILRARPAGTTFELSVDRGRRTLTVPVTTVIATQPPLAGRPHVGIAVLTRDLRYAFPVDVKIDAGSVGGPSAGLAFTLTILDELTPGNLTGGARVAVTGEIEADGSVSEVGAVTQKAVAARHAGATLMLVPVREAREASAHAGKMRVVGVKKLDDALAALRAAGGAPLTVPAPAAAGAAG